MIKIVKGNKKDLLIILSISSIIFFLYSFLLSGWGITSIGDAERYNGYQTYIIRYSLANFGQFALWDQFTSSGSSWISHPGGTLFFPTAWLVMLSTDNILLGSRLFFLIHAITAGVAMYIFLRILKLRRATSFYISIIYLCVQYPFVFGANGWFEEFFAFTLIPIIVGFLWIAFSKQKYLFAVIAGILMSLNFFGSTYYVFHYITIIILWITIIFLLKKLLVIIKNKESLKKIIPFILINIVFWITFIGISGVKLIPLLEFRNLSSRAFLPLSIIESPDRVMDFSYLYNLLRYFLIPAEENTLTAKITNNLTTFVFILAFLYGLIKRKFTYLVFFGLFLIGIWGYLANKIPIDFYALMYKFLPGFSSNNYTYRFYIIIYFTFITYLALGLDLLINNKHKYIHTAGLLIGAFITIAGIVYFKEHFSITKYPPLVYVKEEIKKSSINISIGNNYETPPKISGELSKNLLVTLSEITQKYRPEGRVRSTVLDSDFALTNLTTYLGEIYSTHHSYSSIVPTYQYDITPPAFFNENIDRTVKRYKLLSVLNTRFQIQDKENLEFWGCPGLELEEEHPKNAIVVDEASCTYYKNRLTQLTKNKEGAIYYDRQVLPKVTLIQNPILLISDNRFNDFSSFIAKKIMLHPDFDVKKMTILSSNKNLEDYLPEELRYFALIILVDPKVNDEVRFKRIRSEHIVNHKLIEITSKWITYGSLQERSSSLLTNKPVWNYSDKDDKVLSEIFKNLAFQKEMESNISIRKFTPEDMIFETNNQAENTILQLSDSYYPGWKAMVDGTPASVYMADGLVKGVIAPKKGRHYIRIYYSPESLKIGAAITGFTMSTIILWTVYIRKKIKKRENVVKHKITS